LDADYVRTGVIPSQCAPRRSNSSKTLRKQAEAGDANAQFNIGSMYENGSGVKQDYAEAAKWYRKAAERGDARAQYNLGFMYLNGTGVPQDYAEAEKWYKSRGAGHIE